MKGVDGAGLKTASGIQSWDYCTCTCPTCFCFLLHSSARSETTSTVVVNLASVPPVYGRLFARSSRRLSSYPYPLRVRGFIRVYASVR
jgi:hypothetical protein